MDVGDSGLCTADVGDSGLCTVDAALIVDAAGSCPRLKQMSSLCFDETKFKQHFGTLKATSI
jgi:hypothetical protein